MGGSVSEKRNSALVQRLSVFLLSLLVTSCGCPKRGCFDQLVIKLDAKSWPNGSYIAVMEDPEQGYQCHFAVPMSRNRGGTESSEAGAGGESGNPPTEMDDFVCELSSSMTRSPHPAPKLTGLLRIEMRSTPARVNLTLYFDGRQVFSEQVTPRYRKTRPNGSSCPPTCRQATVEFELEELE